MQSSLLELRKMEDLVESAPFDDPANRAAAGKGTSTPELQALEEKLESAPFDIPEFQVPSSALLSEEQKLVHAKKAMQDYVNSDDGGEAWLGFMSDLVMEEGGD
jgi:hypothetical protein